ncbi:MAG: FAD-dependent oxidoreductase [Cyclobacteriaceae bacterium]|nr:FAD-dependent oxidoreductase [Cyclobacteriaceae bacterium]
MKNCLILILVFISIQLYGQSIFIEAESFNEKGGWLVDPQFVEQMGSPYLLAHGLGQTVENAKTSTSLNKAGKYHVWARTKNWAPGNWEAPGRFEILVNGQKLTNELGLNPEWNWEYAGEIKIKSRDIEIELHDLTGFEGRCDAIFLNKKNMSPPNELKKLAVFRNEHLEKTDIPENEKSYDLVVVGGGIAGCAASIAAAEQGLKVALIHDRPLLGGNASSEIRVHTLGIYGHFERILKMIDTEHYPNGSPEALKDQEKRQQNMENIDNIHLYLNWRAYAANTNSEKISSVDARQTSTGERLRFKAPFFVDCTGDGWIGYWAGAEYMYGRESVNQFGEAWDKHGELWSPEEPDNFVMGASILWRSFESNEDYIFPEVPWAMKVANNHAAKNGEWQWEFSRNDLNQVDDAEMIRDHLLKGIYGSFYNEKQKPGNEKLKLEWVSYLVGKRESRRLVGDHIYTFNDAKNSVKFPDSVVVEEREVDVHYQENLIDPSKPDFLSIALFYKTDRYYVPYRSLYSKNISNLFMAGRNFSCSHVGLGGPRVMRTTGQMGAAVGYAASLCKKYSVEPRAIYEEYLNEYMNLIMTQKTVSLNVE